MRAGERGEKVKTASNSPDGVFNIIRRESVDSTNAEAQRLISGAAAGSEIPFGTVIVANEQTEGRGRRGKTFFSPAADSVYMSLILRPLAPPAEAGARAETPAGAGTGAEPGSLTEAEPPAGATLAANPKPEANTPLTILAAVAVCEAIENIADLKPQIKWVNDIHLHGKKICGILAEAVTNPASGTIESHVLGIGININVEESKFPEEIRQTAASLKIDPGLRENFISELIHRVAKIYKDAAAGISPIDEYRKRSFIMGKDISIIAADGTATPAKAEGITDDGQLMVRYKDGSQGTLSSGEVSILEQNNSKFTTPE
jgi:BirA family biotin operon repressor/biotin-[acetyl-CoA-carboxylase] ligase